MSNIYNYPLSSCDCYSSIQNKYQYDNEQGIPTNMSVRNCNVNDPYLDYNNTIKFSDTNIQPNSKDGLTAINPQVYQEKYSTDFRSANCTKTDSCPALQWISPDPRLISAAHFGQRLTLSNPPIDSTMNLSQLPISEKLNGYGQKYSTYSDVNAGQILYYNDHSREDPFYKPLFTDSAMVTGYLYKDPMGALKPIYERVPVVQDDPVGPKRDNYSGGLSWIQDSTFHREDIMSKQMNVHNQQRWMPRWS
jgi:hypothetical protein